MVRQLKPRTKIKVPKKVLAADRRSVTPLIWYGGKSRDADWIIKHFPPHNTFVDVFGGGASIVLGKLPSVVDVYNDIGNAVNFFWVLRELGDELYERLWLTPWSRDEFNACRGTWQDMSKLWTSSQEFREGIEDWERLEWARAWYATIMQSFSHEEMASSWKTTRSMDLANVWVNKVEELPYFADRFRRIIIENQDFMQILAKYDTEDTLFYLDPPYTPGSRTASNNYVHELPMSRHEEMLRWLTTRLKGQAVVSMYSDPLYERYLKTWVRDEITHNSQIRNSTAETGKRTEVIWIKEHAHGLWTAHPETLLPPKEPSPDVAGVQGEESDL